jgi:hypothetical protein
MSLSELGSFTSSIASQRARQRVGQRVLSLGVHRASNETLRHKGSVDDTSSFLDLDDEEKTGLDVGSEHKIEDKYYAKKQAQKEYLAKINEDVEKKKLASSEIFYDRKPVARNPSISVEDAEKGLLEQMNAARDRHAACVAGQTSPRKVLKYYDDAENLADDDKGLQIGVSDRQLRAKREQSMIKYLQQLNDDQKIPRDTHADDNSTHSKYPRRIQPKDPDIYDNVSGSVSFNIGGVGDDNVPEGAQVQSKFVEQMKYKMLLDEQRALDEEVKEKERIKALHPLHQNEHFPWGKDKPAPSPRGKMSIERDDDLPASQYGVTNFGGSPTRAREKKKEDQVAYASQLAKDNLLAQNLSPKTKASISPKRGRPGSRINQFGKTKEEISRLEQLGIHYNDNELSGYNIGGKMALSAQEAAAAEKKQKLAKQDAYRRMLEDQRTAVERQLAETNICNDAESAITQGRSYLPEGYLPYMRP